MQLPADQVFDPKIGQAEAIAPGLRRIVAPNPSPMTAQGTNTYLLGEDEICVIDPGPDNAAHLAAILAAIGPESRVTDIIVTHSHLDHSPLARPLSEQVGAPVLAFGDAHTGRSAVMASLVAEGLVGGGEGVDTDFQPDRALVDREVIARKDWQLEVLHTPGHLGNHICLAWGNACFTADHVMGWASSIVSPPDGDLTDFMASCRRLAAQEQDWTVFYPGHGAPITEPAQRLAWLMAHREGREKAILSALETGPKSAAALAKQVYTDTPPALLPAATRNVLAHLIDLHGRGMVTTLDPLRETSVFDLRANAASI